MLRRICLRNFKRFREIDLPLGGLTVLMGVNGSGKSTAIQSILVARQSLESSSLDSGFLMLSGDLAQIGTGQDALFEGAGEEESISLMFSSDDGEREIVAQYEASSDRLPISSKDDLGGFSTIGATTFVYLSAERHGPRLLSPLSEGKAAAAQVGAKGEGTLAVLRYHGRALLSEEDPRVLADVSRSIEEQTQAYLASISPGARLDVTSHSNFDSVSAGVSYIGEGGVRTKSFRTTNVGFGISYGLPIIVSCLTAKPGTMLIVENPEAHLHTLGQRKIAELLWRTTKSGVQVLVETHSREFFHHLRKIAKKDKQNESVINYFTNGLSGNITDLDVYTLNPANAPMNDWPDEFFDAFGSPTDLIAKVDH